MKTIIFCLMLASYAFAEEGHEDHNHAEEQKAAVGQCSGGQANCGVKAQKEDEHDHKEEKQSLGEKSNGHGDHDEKESGHADNDEKGHGHGEEGGGHEEEENSGIGPDKGIVAKGENGFKLSEEATKLFDFKTAKIDALTVSLPRSALVQVKDEKVVYRVRDGWIKRLEIKVLKKDKNSLIVEIKEFSPGDSIIVSGTGYIRTTEIVAEEGASEGHSH